MDLTALRTALAGIVARPADNFPAVEYVAESITPPCAVVVPSQPYLKPAADEGTFAEPWVARFDLLLISHREASKTAAALVDDLIEKAFTSLDDHDEYRVTEVSQPGLVTLNGARFMGAVMTIEQDIEEP